MIAFTPSDIRFESRGYWLDGCSLFDSFGSHLWPPLALNRTDRGATALVLR